jgi:uncharacterized membrane protein YhaH (DUF805 family)
MLALTLVALVAAGVVGFVALLSGSRFAASGPSSPTQSVVLWIVAGLCVSAPVAALPSWGFATRRRTAWLAAAAVAAVVAVVGVWVLNQP